MCLPFFTLAFCAVFAAAPAAADVHAGAGVNATPAASSKTDARAGRGDDAAAADNKTEGAATERRGGLVLASDGSRRDQPRRADKAQWTATEAKGGDEDSSGAGSEPDVERK